MNDLETELRLRCAELATDYCKTVVEVEGLGKNGSNPVFIAESIYAFVTNAAPPQPDPGAPPEPESEPKPAPNRAARRAAKKAGP